MQKKKKIVKLLPLTLLRMAVKTPKIKRYEMSDEN